MTRTAAGFATLLLAIACTACGSLHNPPEARPVDAAPDRPAEGPATTDPTVSAADVAPDRGSPGEPSVALAIEVAPVPGEELTDSPHDVLGEVTPELTPDELSTIEPKVAVQPTFDLPIVVNDKVLGWVDYYANRQRASFEPGLVRSGRYISMFREIFAEAGLPRDLVYMAHVESAYKTTAYSRARAKGIFQFIAATGRRYGLRIDYWVDERSDPEKSAGAAAAYLGDLYDEFGDWYLALAGYNAGEGRVRYALRNSGTRDFWEMRRYFRRETRNYVPAILAATMISKEPDKYGFDFVPDAPLHYDTVRVDGGADLRVLAECAETDLETMKLLNPALRRQQTPPGATTDVRVPPGAAARTIAALERIPPAERVLYARHTVAPGDTLSEISRHYDVSVGAIQQANNMGRSTMIRLGRVLLVPTSSASEYPSIPDTHTTGEILAYRVRRGDTLYGIARRYGTTSSSVAAASGVPVSATLHPGDRLTVVTGVRSPAEARRIARGGASGREVHTVRRGETLWSIATRHDTTIESLCSLNRISPGGVLQPGVRLTVR